MIVIDAQMDDYSEAVTNAAKLIVRARILRGSTRAELATNVLAAMQKGFVKRRLLS